MQTTQWTDRRVEDIIGTLLRTGVVVAALVTLAGGIVYLIRNGHSPANYRVFRGEPTDLRHIRGILRETRARPRWRRRGLARSGIRSSPSR